MNKESTTIDPHTTTLAEIGILDSDEIQQVQRLLVRMDRRHNASEITKAAALGVVNVPVTAIKYQAKAIKNFPRNNKALIHLVAVKIEDKKAIRLARKEREDKQRETDSVKGHKILTKLQQEEAQAKATKDAAKAATKEAKRVQKEQEAAKA